MIYKIVQPNKWYRIALEAMVLLLCRIPVINLKLSKYTIQLHHHEKVTWTVAFTNKTTIKLQGKGPLCLTVITTKNGYCVELNSLSW
jgi:hypothetical protein